jgi:hypothetical protein
MPGRPPPSIPGKPSEDVVTFMGRNQAGEVYHRCIVKRGGDILVDGEVIGNYPAIYWLLHGHMMAAGPDLLAFIHGTIPELLRELCEARATIEDLKSGKKTPDGKGS